MDINLSAFREPRGVMRVIHFIFSICAFATITGYTGYTQITCKDDSVKKEFEYPFDVYYPSINVSNCVTSLTFGYSSDARYFVATGVLAMLYSLAISIVYIKFDEMYKSNNQLPMIDFVITVIFGVLWISSSAAWATGLSGLKSMAEPTLVSSTCLAANCKASTSNFSTLNISVIFGFLNFFLWAADLWFLYKETSWFPGNQPQTTSGV
ncbi:synaptoporin-like [Tribolium madens]|uniref:synaptoporin-like n=1 Tax=Tribolium madens TaxID=41895 RepID=UPI001CF75342|nr:synaptoporin-like [Tribolium madens]XP_044256744.1 synaptoporin-like [Tribolium madens]